MVRGICFCIALITLPNMALANCPIGAASAADQITGHINAVHGNVQTACFPSSEPTTCSIVCFTATRITAFQEMSQWLAAGESAIHGLADRSRVQFDYLHMADRGLLEQQLTLRIPSQRAFDAQSRTSAQSAGASEQSVTIWDRFALHQLPPLIAPSPR